MKLQQLEIISLIVQGQQAMIRRDYETSKKYYADAGVLSKEINDKAGEARSLLFLSIIEYYLKNPDKQRQLLEEGYKIAKELQSREIEAAILNNLIARQYFRELRILHFHTPPD